LYVQIVKIQKHIHQFNFPTSFYSFRHPLIFYEATQKTYFYNNFKTQNILSALYSLNAFPFCRTFSHTRLFSSSPQIHVSLHIQTCPVTENFPHQVHTQISQFSGFSPFAVKKSPDRTFCNTTIVKCSGDFYPMFYMSWNALF